MKLKDIPDTKAGQMKEARDRVLNLLPLLEEELQFISVRIPSRMQRSKENPPDKSIHYPDLELIYHFS